MKKQLMPKKRQGFTLVELLLATALFSFVLVAVVGGLVNALNIYAGARTSRHNQEAMRVIMEDIGQRANFATTMSIDGSNRLCIQPANQPRVVYYTQPAINPTRVDLMRADWPVSTSQPNPNCSSLNAGSALSTPIKINPTDTSINVFNPQRIANTHDPISDPEAVDALSLNLDITIRKAGDPATLLVGGGKFFNTYEEQTTFFASNQ